MAGILACTSGAGGGREGRAAGIEYGSCSPSRIDSRKDEMVTMLTGATPRHPADSMCRTCCGYPRVRARAARGHPSSNPGRPDLLAPPCLPRLLCLSCLGAVLRPLHAGLALLPEDAPRPPCVVDAAPLGAVGFPS